MIAEEQFRNFGLTRHLLIISILKLSWNLQLLFFCIPSIESIKQIQIRDSTEQILSVAYVSDNSPQVSLQTPQGGEIFHKGSIVNITWTATDPDGDGLIFSLLYSNDGGETWFPLATDTTQNCYEFHTKYLQPGNYLIKVLATDGFNTAEAVSDQPITIEGIHDIAILDIAFSKQNLSTNETIFIYITLQNNGDF